MMARLRCEYCEARLKESECFAVWVDYGRFCFRPAANGFIKEMLGGPYRVCSKCKEKQLSLVCDFCERHLDEGEGFAMWASNGEICFRSTREEPSEEVPDRPYLICQNCRIRCSVFEEVRSGGNPPQRGGLLWM
jgi:hypothetical protein